MKKLLLLLVSGLGLLSAVYGLDCIGPVIEDPKDEKDMIFWGVAVGEFAKVDDFTYHATVQVVDVIHGDLRNGETIQLETNKKYPSMRTPFPRKDEKMLYIVKREKKGSFYIHETSACKNDFYYEHANTLLEKMHNMRNDPIDNRIVLGSIVSLVFSWLW